MKQENAQNLFRPKIVFKKNLEGLCFKNDSLDEICIQIQHEAKKSPRFRRGLLLNIKNDYLVNTICLRTTFCSILISTTIIPEFKDERST